MTKHSERADESGALLIRVSKRFIADDMAIYAAALAFQILLAIFPFILFLVTLLGFLHLPDFFTVLRQQAAVLLPAQAMAPVNHVIDELQQRHAGLLSFAILAALWSASGGMRAAMHALNVAYGVEETRAAWKRYLLSIVYTIGLAALVLMATALMVIGPGFLDWLTAQIGLQQAFVTLWTWLRWPVAILLLIVAISLIYHLAPDIRQRFRILTPGAVLAVVVWITTSLAFGYYVQNVAQYNLTYGSMGAIVVLMFFFYLSAAVLLFGAEVNAALRRASPNTLSREETREPHQAAVSQSTKANQRS